MKELEEKKFSRKTRLKLMLEPEKPLKITPN